jgi:hypothetical protein
MILLGLGFITPPFLYFVCLIQTWRLFYFLPVEVVPIIPILWITKEMMSQGPQVADMECRETT